MKIEDVKKIGVLGCGTMGSGIVQVCATFGYVVIGRDINEDVLKNARTNIIEGRFGLKRGVERGKLTKEQMENAIKNITLTTSMEEMCDGSDIIIETAPEDLALKMELYKEMDKLSPKKSILASNTSGFPITPLGMATERPDRVVGMHWFNPPPVMRGIEIVKTGATSEETVNCINDLSTKLGKTPIIIKDSPRTYGFVTTRLLSAVVREARQVVQEGIATPEQVDQLMMLGFNWPAGPLFLTGWVGRLGLGRREQRR